MSEFQPAAQSDFIREMQRLVDAQREAIRSKDQAAIEDTAHDLTTFLRLNSMGRIAEWFNSRGPS